MKKILYALIALATLLGMTMCAEEEKYIFGESPDERAEAQLNSYQEILCSASCGWLVSVGTQDRSAVGGAYQFWMKFTPDNRVVMYADIDDNTATQPSAGSYRMKLMQFPTLMFDTYNYLHLLADPNGTAVPGSTKAKGLLSDFDICLDDRTGGDEFKATGRVQKCPFIFTKATPEDTMSIVNGMAFIDARKAAQTRLTAISPAPVVDVDNLVIQISGGNLLRLTSFFYKDENEQVQAVTIPTYVDFGYNIRLMEPFSYGNIEFDRIHWNGTNYEVPIHGDSHETYDYGGFMFPLEFGFGKSYSQLKVDKAALGAYLQDPFLSVYNAAEASLTTLDRTLKFFRIEFRTATQMRLYHEYTNNATGAAASVSLYFTINYDADGYIYLTDKDATPISISTSTYAAALAENLLSYFLYEGEFTIGPSSNRKTVRGQGHKFRLDWLDATQGAFIVTTDPSNYVPGTLIK
jgi:hypothetical protein